MAITCKRINSRQKGKRGERAFRDVLRGAGYQAHRAQQFRGGNDSPDVVCPELPEIHWEVKCCESGNIYTWLEQAEGDTWQHPQHGRMLKIPIVAHKRNGRKWVAILPIEGLGLLEIIRRSDLPRLSETECTYTDLNGNERFKFGQGSSYIKNNSRT